MQKYVLCFSGVSLYRDCESLPEISSQRLFGNDNPLILDLGCGKGEFPVDLAKNNPGVNYVGLDRHWKSLYFATNLASQAGILNIKFVRQDLRFGLKKVLNDSVSTAYLLFPPPPTKQGLIKKDFVTQELFLEITRVLEPGGKLVFGSDKPDFFSQKMELLGNIPNIKEGGIAHDDVKTRFKHIWEKFGVQPNLVTFSKKL